MGWFRAFLRPAETPDYEKLYHQLLGFLETRADWFNRTLEEQ
jgi:hypothetical protein